MSRILARESIHPTATNSSKTPITATPVSPSLLTFESSKIDDPVQTNSLVSNNNRLPEPYESDTTADIEPYTAHSVDIVTDVENHDNHIPKSVIEPMATELIETSDTRLMETDDAEVVETQHSLIFEDYDEKEPHSPSFFGEPLISQIPNSESNSNDVDNSIDPSNVKNKNAFTGTPRNSIAQNDTKLIKSPTESITPTNNIVSRLQSTHETVPSFMDKINGFDPFELRVSPPHKPHILNG